MLVDEVDSALSGDIRTATEALPPELAGLVGDRTVWHLNSTATGGGVAELLHRSVRFHNRHGLRTRWLVLTGEPDFFAVTKRLHHRLHGSPDPVGELGPAERKTYETTARSQAEQVLGRLAPGDLCVLHDPQTLGLAPYLADAGLRVAWRCHIGTTAHAETTRDTWRFLEPYLRAPVRCGFSVDGYAPPWMERDTVVILPPSIDPSAPKNRRLTDATVQSFLSAISLQAGPTSGGDDRVARSAHVLQDRQLPPEAPVVLQVSRWDPLKDMNGVLRTFVHHVAPARPDAHLVLAGPEPADIPDDPEGAAIHGSVADTWRTLPPQVRGRVHLVNLSLKDAEANAHVVNALQTRADVVIQKSLKEGFGLTVTEAMWKGKAIVASAVGGIPTQIRDGREGLLVSDPRDLEKFGDAVVRLLLDADLRRRLGTAAHDRCAERFLAGHEFRGYCSLYAELLQRP
ncbi:glycosyltransferase [Streptomyces sp. NPDC050704]|uniref:glycosyltransferase n=1 Tax=Streptomyces sp. NPDC050704 TaxID=3157219 RepID=UPI0034475313